MIVVRAVDDDDDGCPALPCLVLLYPAQRRPVRPAACLPRLPFSFTRSPAAQKQRGSNGGVGGGGGGGGWAAAAAAATTTTTTTRRAAAAAAAAPFVLHLANGDERRRQSTTTPNVAHDDRTDQQPSHPDCLSNQLKGRSLSLASPPI